MVDLSVYSKQKTLNDYLQENDDAEFKRQLLLRKIQSGSDDPSAIKIVNDMQKSAAIANDPNVSEKDRAVAAHRYNLLNQVAKSFAIDRGMNAEVPSLYGDGGQPNFAPSAPPAISGAADAGDGKIDIDAVANELVSFGPQIRQSPRINPMPVNFGGVSAVPGFAQTAGGIAATKKGMETQAQKNVELNMNPMIESATTKAHEDAKNLAAAQFELPTREGGVEKIQSLISRIENHPGLPAAVGVGNPFMGKIPFFDAGVGGSPAADFFALQEQLKGSGFLEAIQQMKGLGALSNQEGDAATKAYASLQTSQSEKQYKENLGVLRDTINKGLERARAKAGKPSQVPPPGGGSSGQPRMGSIVDGYVFLGGDPSQQSSWKKAK